MEVAVPRQEKSNQHTEDKLNFSRCSKTFGASKRKAEEETMGCLEKINAVRTEVTFAQQEQSNQHTNIKLDKNSICSKAFGISEERKVQQIYEHHTHAKKNSEGKEDTLVCSKGAPKLPSKKGDDSKKFNASNKKRKLEDDLLIDDFEQDEEVMFLLKTKTRSKASTMDNEMVTIFLSAFFFCYTSKAKTLIVYDRFF